jgi:hypothetical protein
MLLLLVLSCVTHELLIFLYSLSSQFFVLFIMILREYLAVKAVHGLCLTPENSGNNVWPSLEQAQLGALFGFIGMYSYLWKCWPSFWITKVMAMCGVFAVFLALIILRVTSFFSAVTGFLLGLLFIALFLYCTLYCLDMHTEREEFQALLRYSMCTDTLICTKHWDKPAATLVGYQYVNVAVHPGTALDL